MLYLLILKKRGDKRSIGDSCKICVGLVLLEMDIGAAAGESQHVNLFHISLDVFFSTSIEISYVYGLLYLPLHEAKILKLRKLYSETSPHCQVFVILVPSSLPAIRKQVRTHNFQSILRSMNMSCIILLREIQH